MTDENIFDLLKCSVTFKVSSLKSNICDYLITILEKFSVHDLIDIYTMSTQYDSPDLETKCIELINQNSKIIVNTAEWKRLTEKYPHLVVKAFFKA